MGNKLTYAVVILAVMLLIPAVVLATSGDNGGDDNRATNSVRITIDGNLVEGPVKEGDVIHRGDADRECVFPPISIKMRGDVRRVRVGPEGNTCDFKIKLLEMNETPIPSEPEHGRGFSDRTLGDLALATAGWKWRIDVAGKVVGVNSIDDLTKTKASFTFKTGSISGGGPLYDGNIGTGGSCWGKHTPQPPYYYYVDTCTLTDYDVTSQTKMFSEMDGEYIHTLFASFGHSVTSEAIAHGYENMPDVFDSDCSGVSLPPLADLECDLLWVLLGYQ